MKKGIHPNWTHQAQVTCSCGNKFTVGSTSDVIQVDICNKCHPFFTGEMKFVDRQGRVDKFMKKVKKAEDIKSKSIKKVSADKNPTQEAKSYKDVLRQQQTVLKQVGKNRNQKSSEEKSPEEKTPAEA
ncbi:MAG: 50S ribosomal protein L31 [Pseudomonadales bacterium]|nr:50S ribosomal protein L31 [Pseudomonadales bacterium]